MITVSAGSPNRSSRARGALGRLLLRGALLATLLVAAAPTARADEPAPSPHAGAAGPDHKSLAIELFREGTAAFERGDFAAAARAFESSYEHVPRAAAMVNAARSWDRGGDPARAADDYLLALERTDLHGVEADAARHRLEELEGTLGVVEVRAPRGWRVRVGRVDAVSPVVKVHLSPGDWPAAAESPQGAVLERRVHVEARRTTAIAFEAAPPIAARSVDRPDGLRSTLGWAALGASVVSAGAAVPLGLATLGARDRFRADPTSQERLDEAKTLRTWTNVAWGSCAVFAVTGIVLLLTAPRATGAPASW